MTQERFFRIVDDPDLLRTITYEELKTLALAYPYAHNLRYLLAIKARQIDHQDVVKNVATAAAYSLDRTQLFRLVAPQMIAPQEVWMEEEVLELKPIETLKRKLEEELTGVSREEKQATAPLEAVAVRTPETAPVPEPKPAPLQKTDLSAVVEETPLPQIPYQSFAAWIGHFYPPVLETIAALPVVKPAVVETVSVQQTVPAQVQMPDIQKVELDEEGEPVREAPKTLGIAQVLAEKSVAENKDVISETLAKLYAKQGYREKAIAMYDRLGLAFPEKSAYFAAEIDKLKK
jgi:hypothetical protein